jgi:vacuolar protein sorting-associated protein 18
MDQWGDEDEEEEVGRGNPFGGSSTTGGGNPFGGGTKLQNTNNSGNPFGNTVSSSRRGSNQSGNQNGNQSGNQSVNQSGNPFGNSTMSGGGGPSQHIPANPFGSSTSNDYGSSSSSALFTASQEQNRQHKQKPFQSSTSQQSLRQSKSWVNDSDDDPLLRLRVMDGWAPGGGEKPIIRAIAAAHRTLAIATENETVLWWDTSNDSGPVEFDLASKGGRSIEAIFLDPTGHHLIISMVTGDNYYLHSSFDRVRSLKKMSNVFIQSVAWDKHGGSETSTHTILVGGRSGDIYEAQLDPRKKDKYWKKVYQLDDDVPVCGLEYELFPDSNNTNINIDDKMENTSPRGGKYFVMAVTAQPTRYYQFVGGPSFEDLFSKFGSGSNQMPARFNEFGTELPYSELHLFSKNHVMRAESFAMLTEVGILHGQLMFGSQNAGDSVVKDTKLLDYAMKTRKGGGSGGGKKGDHHHHRNSGGGNNVSNVINGTSSGGTSSGDKNDNTSMSERGALLSMTVTEFHFLLLYQYCLCACTRITHEIVYEQELIPTIHGNAKGIVRDPRGNIWLFSKNSLFQIQLEREDRNVWKLYLQQAKAGDGREFEFAFQHAKTAEQQNLVRALQADHYFNRSDYIVAARYYAKTKRSFEEVSLKFISNTNNASNLSNPLKLINLKKALKIYLIEKLKFLPSNDKTQKTILSMWLVEMYLNEMNDIDNDQNNVINNDEYQLQKTTLTNEFKRFLRDHKSQVCGLNRECAETTYQLISAHGQMSILLYFAELIEDYERMMTHYIQEENYIKAVKLLVSVVSHYRYKKKQKPPDKVIELFYKFSPTLMEHAPKTTVDAWITMRSDLDPSKLIPALVRYSQQLQSKSRASKARKEKERRLLVAQQRLGKDSGGGTSETKIAPSPSSSTSTNDLEMSYAIKYLDYCVHRLRNTQSAIHNFLLWLYAQQPDDGESVLKFVNERVKPCFDLDYALRVCMQANQKKACIKIYTMMDLFDEAVTLALQIGEINLAKDHARSAKTDDVQKKLWLKIAKKVIEQVTHEYRDGDIKEAIKILKDSNDLLKIEDILPLFPDFTTIDDFKKEICEALEEYNEKIDGLKEEMADYVDSAKDIRKDIKQLR